MLPRPTPSSTSLARPAVRAAIAGALGAALLLGTLNDKEGASLSRSVRKALNDTADGQSVEWSFPAAGRRQQIDGTIAPIESKTDKGQPCRRLKSELKRGSAEEHWSGWFCKQSNGQWKSRHVGE